MLFEPTPRMLVNDLYRLDKERHNAHEDGIRSIMSGDKREEHFEKRDQLKQDQEQIRNHLRSGQE